jgi:hypothetical protein
MDIYSEWEDRDTNIFDYHEEEVWSIFRIPVSNFKLRLSQHTNVGIGIILEETLS